MDSNELLVEIVKAQNRTNEILLQLRWIGGVLLAVLILTKCAG